TLSAIRIGDYKYRFTDQPQGWLGGTVKVDWPMITNLRLDPFERMAFPNGANGSLNFYHFYVHEFWRFTFVQFPPIQRGASFNMEAVKAQVEAAIEKARTGRN
ncbi:MAG TPA: arylsulfatase, partial [Thermoanaerobaculia bacterium]|nr:arylsulfatase [Thermoanaerobaculia bacterium]